MLLNKWTKPNWTGSWICLNPYPDIQTLAICPFSVLSNSAFKKKYLSNNAIAEVKSYIATLLSSRKFSSGYSETLKSEESRFHSVQFWEVVTHFLWHRKQVLEDDDKKLRWQKVENEYLEGFYEQNWHKKSESKTKKIYYFKKVGWSCSIFF